MEKKKKSRVLGIITSILIFALGIAALFLPMVAASALTTFLGAFLIAMGVMMFVMAFTCFAVGFGAFFVGGIISLIIGILLINNPSGVVKVIVIIFAVLALLSGIFKVTFSFQCIAMRNKYWISELIFGALYLVISIAIFVNLNKIDYAQLLAYCFGAYLIILGISKFIDSVSKDTPEYNIKVSQVKEFCKEKHGKKEFANEDEVVDGEFTEKKEESSESSESK